MNRPTQEFQILPKKIRLLSRKKEQMNKNDGLVQESRKLRIPYWQFVKPYGEHFKFIHVFCAMWVVKISGKVKNYQSF